MKRITSILLTGFILLSFSLSAVQAAGNTAEWNLTAEKTDIKCTGVYNVSGYGVVSFDGPYDETGYGEGWPWYGLVDSSGKYVVKAKPGMEDPKMNTYGNTFFITEGVICDYRRGFYNLDGSEIFDIHIYKPENTKNVYIDDPLALPFSNGYSLIQYTIYPSGDDSGWGGEEPDPSPLYLVDKKGNVVKNFPHSSERMFYGGDGLWMASDLYSYARYYDYQGNLVVDLSDAGYGNFGTFKDGYAWVGKSQTGPYGYVNKAGIEVIPCVYDNVNLFNDGLAGAQKNGKWGYINTSGETVIPFEYDSAYGAGDGLVCVSKDGKLGFADYNNNLLPDLEDWDDLSSFAGGVAYGVKNGSLYIIRNGPQTKKSLSPIVTVTVTGITVLVSTGVLWALKAKKAAEAAASKIAAKSVKVKFGHRTLVVVSKNEDLIKYLRRQPNLKIKTCEEGKLAETIKDVKPDLVIREISSDEQLHNYVETRINPDNGKPAHGVILTDELSQESMDLLKELKKQKKIISYVNNNTSSYKTMTELVLPVMKPDVSTDDSLANIGSVADALGIPYISKIISVYTSGRSIKETIEDDEGILDADDTVSIVNDIASILNISELEEVTGFISDIKKVRKAVKNDAGAYEFKEGFKGAKDIVDTLKK